jgi:hypothetical protein
LQGEDNRTTLMIKNIPNKYVVPNFNTWLYSAFWLLFIYCWNFVFGTVTCIPWKCEVLACSMIST